MRELELLNNISNPSVDRPWWRLNKAYTHSEPELNIKPGDEKCCGVTQRSKGSVREETKPLIEKTTVDIREPILLENRTLAGRALAGWQSFRIVGCKIGKVFKYTNTWDFREAYFNYVLLMGGKPLNQTIVKSFWGRFDYEV